VTDPIPFKVIRSTRRTADIVVERDGSVVVRAPDWANDALLKEIVEAKSLWIYKSLAEWRDLNATRVIREFRNGEGFLYMGRSYRLLLVADQRDALLLRNGRFQLRRDLAEKGEESAKTAFLNYYISRGTARIGPRITYYSPKVGVVPKSFEVRELGHRWASCSSDGHLTFHWKCMMAPLKIIDYIVVHELCHFHQKDHSDAFWNEVDKVMPDYRERKEWLRRHGAGLDV